VPDSPTRGPDAVELLAQVTAAIPDGEDRPAQVEMTRAVQTAFRTKRHLAVQGPTGVGKSLAYLLPAIAAAGPDDRTVVVTSSKALQDQLAKVDLPFLEATLDRPFSYAVLKGRSNYLCAAALDEVRVQLRRGTQQQHLELGSADDAAVGTDLSDDELRAQVEALVDWAETTDHGDMAELEDAPSWQAWSAVSVGPGECVGAASCSFAEDCWSEQARAAADEADVVVVNAHLYGAHIQTGRTLLPEHTRLVIDEAHEFEDSIVGSLSVELTEGRLANLARVHERSVADETKVGTSLRSAGQMLEALLTGMSTEATGPTSQVRLRDGLDTELSAVVSTVVAAADRALNSLRRAAKHAGQTNARHRIDRAVRVAEGVLGDAQALLGSQGAGTVCWIESTRNGRHALRLTRIDIAATLKVRAWEDSGLTVVCCSATLDRGTSRRLGLDAEYLAVPSPFDFREQALLYVPKVARPNHPDWPEQVAEVVTHLIRQLDGRTLALFTSNRMLHATVERCREALPDHTILAQGDAPNPVLQRRFLAEEHTSLFATASFWTGISSPGTTCSAVILDKIPFPVPSDPIIEARSELVGDQRAFMEVSVPAAAMQLAQGVGRLIRTATDRGVVAICDPRLAEARYREQILELLPPMRRVRNADFVDRFISSLELPPGSAPDERVEASA
jgi:ATP-dependent DNA helicase DinG